MRDIFPHEVDRFGPAFPRGVEYRKHWEVAMAARALRDFGALGPASEILGVGAGNEPTLFWLTRHVRRVFATDLYLDPGDWGGSAGTGMLTDPERYWPSPWNPRRLVVQHMNALDLEFEDHSFQGIFSSSSIEHFGDLGDVRRAIGEMHRVLVAGGVLSLSTEFRLEGPGPGLPGILMFNAQELADAVTSAAEWELSDLDLRMDSESLGTQVRFADAAADVRSHIDLFGEILFHKLDWSTYPQIVLAQDPLVWTSIHLALKKPRPEPSR
jgi:SAM-dependent methyltransferase